MKQPSFSGIKTFFGVPTTADKNTDITMFGVPFDLGTTNRPGARFGPEGVRSASAMFVGDTHTEYRLDPTKALKIADIGDLEILNGDLLNSIAKFEDQIDMIKTHKIGVGGDHTITLPILRSLKKQRGKPVCLVHFDAHVDTWKDNFGAAVGHGTPFHYASEEGLIDPENSIQIGIRSPADNGTMDYTRELGFTIVTAEEVHMGQVYEIAAKIREVIGDRDAYLTFDIDCLDPSCAPGTGTPEAGGLFSWQALAIIKRLKDLNWVGMDLVEVAPAYDHAQITAVAGATIIWTYLSMIASKKEQNG